MSDEQRRLGQWYTPAPVVELVLALAGTAVRGARVLDPACGDGRMLVAARDHGARARIGIDVDAAALITAGALDACARLITADATTAIDVGGLGEVDVVLGNPPWVSAAVDAGGRRRRAAVLARDWPATPAAVREALARRADLAAMCLLAGLRALRPGGRLVMVLSSALLDADAAAPLWTLVASAGRVRTIVAAPAQRWFPAVAVKPMIVVIERGAAAAPVELARLRALPADAARHLRRGGALAAIADVRTGDPAAPRAWARALRAPASWFDLADAAGDRLVPLGELADIRRGATTGANRFFYVKRAAAAAARLEPALLAPVVRAPYNGAPCAIAIDPATTPIVAIRAPATLRLRDAPGFARWVRAHRAVADRASVGRRTPWWALPAEPARVFVAKAYGPRYVQRWSPAPVLADQRVYAVEPRAGVEHALLAAVLNAVTTSLALEALGRASMGFGAIEWTTRDLAELPVVDVRAASAAQRARIEAAFRVLAPRAVENVDVERDRPDRRALDAAVLALVPGGAALHDALWDALCTAALGRDRRRWGAPGAT